MIAPVHLRGTAALLAQCRVLICNDTGLMHLAAAVGTPVVAVFACTSPRLYLPRGGTAVARWAQPCSHVVHDDFGVAPCVAGARCLDPGHRLLPEQWAGAATAAALRHLQQRALWQRRGTSLAALASCINPRWTTMRKLLLLAMIGGIAYTIRKVYEDLERNPMLDEEADAEAPGLERRSHTTAGRATGGYPPGESEAERKSAEGRLDETLRDSFPASDPPSFTR